LTQEKKLAEKKLKSNKDWILWTVAAVFIVGSIAFMFVIDLIYAPSVKHSVAQPATIDN
jgi:hypothetical protein